jgi:hypothetical protein
LERGKAGCGAGLGADAELVDVFAGDLHGVDVDGKVGDVVEA